MTKRRKPPAFTGRVHSHWLPRLQNGDDVTVIPRSGDANVIQMRG